MEIDHFSAVTQRPKSEPFAVSVGIQDLTFPTKAASLPHNKARRGLRFNPMNKIANRFNRRKSSGNVLEFGEAPPAGESSSFRVLQRPAQPGQETDGYLRKPPQLRPRTSPHANDRRPYSYFGDGSDSTSNRGSGNTNNSNATTLDSQKRFSYASTEPSSVDDSLDDNGDLPFQPRQRYAPLPRSTTEPVDPEPQSRKSFSLKAAGRAFSFGAKSAKNIPRDVQDVPPPLPTQRDRSMTTSSYASTATPPKLDLGSGTGLGLGDSDFGDIFAKRKSTIMEEPSPTFPPPTHNPSRAPPQARTGSPAQTQSANSTYLNYQAPSYPPRQNSSPSDNYPPRDVPPRKTGSPYSFQSAASEERLMSSPRQGYRDSPDFRSSPKVNTDVDSSVVLDALNASRFLDNEHSPQPPRHVPETNPMPRTRGARPSPSAYRGPEPPRRSPLSEVGPRNTNNYLGQGMDGFSNVDLNPQGAGAGDDEPLFDAPRPRKIWRNPVRTTTAPAGNGKVMTPAEFAEYKKHKENAPPEEEDQSDASSNSETYEDDDEVERQKEAAKQRRKQEAHLAVYRQQMMKVTGEQPSELPSQQPPRMPLERSSASAPMLLGSMNFESKPEQQGSKSSQEDDEDEEVPLGVLQAHGFPSRNRPPTRMSSSTSAIPRPESQVGSYPAPALTTRNDAAAGGGGNPNLPIFAKHLPQDPYVGASLVNAPTRESLAFNSSQGASQGPPPQAGGGNLPPGGLVGVIATEERNKAMRRGSPNTRGTYDPVPSMQLPHEVHQQQMMQQMMQQQMPPQHSMMHQGMPQSPMPQTPGGMSPGEQSQMQIANQMTQMMQMQMQFMQWAMQNNGQMPPMPPGMQLPGMQTPGGTQTPQLPQQNFGQPGFLNTDPMARPGSMASHHQLGQHQRASSNFSRGPSPGHLSTSTNGLLGSSQSVYGMQAGNGGYAPSIAPSERSNVGQPSRYRPVTPGGNQNQERESRTSSMSQQTVQALKTQRSKSRLRNEATNDSPKTIIRAVERPKHGGRGGNDDDDDDEGWAEMQRQRKARQSRWKQTKTQSTMSGAQEGGLEGLYYEGPQA